ncbi:5-formyltetrahydrofolate cyclo-ligase [Crucibulum laeve]|uniref:5-formyltetrahydrofolate cyclo-ligase n=1 Tax=Crucibulum laeve TaxID=68775 RepID=A0A5C3LYV7_9AGAR|nr:5-formyltetrahydrofolate cyclo-ligase [Crucibulum laeve]
MAATLQNSLKAQKKVLRKAISSKLSSLPGSSVEEQSQAVVARVLELPCFRRCKTISCYLSMPFGEVDTSKLVLESLASGKTLFVPRIQSKEGHMEFLKIYGTDDLASLPNGTWGIKEPEMHWQGKSRTNALESNSEPLDMILLPGVAFDRSLSRLGHGKGYYDRFISSYVATGRRRPFLVGLALREQIVGDKVVPMGAHDWKLDLVVTPDETLGGSTVEVVNTSDDTR